LEPLNLPYRCLVCLCCWCYHVSRLWLGGVWPYAGVDARVPAPFFHLHIVVLRYVLGVDFDRSGVLVVNSCGALPHLGVGVLCLKLYRFRATFHHNLVN
jgi:hypothetical protein